MTPKERMTISPKIFARLRLLGIVLIASIIGAIFVGAYVALATALVVGIMVGAAAVPGATPSIADDARAGTPAEVVTGPIAWVGLSVGAVIAAAATWIVLQTWALRFAMNWIVLTPIILITVGLVRKNPRVAAAAALTLGTVVGATVAPFFPEALIIAPTVNIIVGALGGGSLAALMASAEATDRYYNYRAGAKAIDDPWK
jgi:hypothetical protein